MLNTGSEVFDQALINRFGFETPAYVVHEEKTGKISRVCLPEGTTNPLAPDQLLAYCHEFYKLFEHAAKMCDELDDLDDIRNTLKMISNLPMGNHLKSLLGENYILQEFEKIYYHKKVELMCPKREKAVLPEGEYQVDTLKAILDAFPCTDLLNVEATRRLVAHDNRSAGEME